MNDNMPDNPRIVIGGNLPPEPIEEEERRAVAKRDAEAHATVAALVGNANRWLQHPIIDNEDVAGDCNDTLQQLEDHWKALDGRRAEEKKPHDLAAAAIQARYLPLLEQLTICRRAIKPLHDAWLRLRQQRIDAGREAARREAAEAQRLADQLAEQAKAGGPGAVTNRINAAEAAREAEKKRQIAAAVPLRAQSRGNLGSRVRSLRTYWFADVVNWSACFNHFQEPDPNDPNKKIPVAEVREVLTRLAMEAARKANNPMRNPNPAGCWVFSEEK